MSELDVKRNLYNKLNASKATALVLDNGKNITKTPLSCVLYYNRRLGEITEDNIGSFKKITASFTVNKYDLIKDIDEIKQVVISLKDTETGVENGFLLNYKCNKKIEEKFDFKFEITFDEEGKTIIKCNEEIGPSSEE
jgi:hypothetical protein